MTRDARGEKRLASDSPRPENAPDASGGPHPPQGRPAHASPPARACTAIAERRHEGRSADSRRNETAASVRLFVYAAAVLWVTACLGLYAWQLVRVSGGVD
jgi:hypothetical protein